MKLYHRYSRFAYRRYNHKSDDLRIRWALSLNAGDLINDCSGFNRVVREIEPQYHFNKRGGWAITGVDFTTEPHGGGCSLMHCGVEPAISREKLEAHYLSDNTGRRSEEWKAWGANWYSGVDNPEYIKWVAHIEKRISVLQAGGHILDERGILLSEFSNP